MFLTVHRPTKIFKIIGTIMITWKIETRKLTSLREHPKNPRKLSKDQHAHLTQSLQKFGVAEKPIINVDGMIIGGHQRLKVLKELGYKELECWVPSEALTEAQCDEMNIRLNRNTGEWDFDLLANEWQIDDLLEWGFTPEEFGIDLNAEMADEEGDGTTNDVGRDEDAFTKLGDIYELGNHRLACGDSTDSGVVTSVLNGESPILLITDPPYGVDYDPNWRKISDGNKGRSVKSFGKVHNDDRCDWTESYKFFKGNICYVWHSGNMSCIVEKNLQDCGFEIVNQIIWVKQLGFGRGDYHPYHEPCWYAVKKGCNHNWQGSRKERTVWEIQSRAALGDVSEMEEATGHSTQKPLECMARPIRNNTAEGEGVYDPFLGSGTTLIAAEKLNRRCFAIELSPAYVDICVKRYIKFMTENGRPYEIKRNGEPFECPI